MLLLAYSGRGIAEYMPIILSTQLIAAVAGAGFRLPRIRNPRASLGESISIGLASVAAISSAQLVGVYMDDAYRTLYTGGLLVLAAGVNLFSVERDPWPSAGARYLYSVSSGALAGLVKGVLGAGITPLLIILQRIIGKGFEDTVFRVLSSEIIVIVSALIPYALYYGLDPIELAVCGVAAFTGVYIFRRLDNPSIRGWVSGVSTILMALLGIMLIALSYMIR